MKAYDDPYDEINDAEYSDAEREMPEQGRSSLPGQVYRLIRNKGLSPCVVNLATR